MELPLTVHMMVKNEEQWVWYAIQSVLRHIKEVIIFDTGSMDKTQEIISTIKSKKIRFFEKGSVAPTELVKLRNEQIQLTQTEWFMLVDGDEVWSEAGVAELKNVLATVPRKIQALVSPTLMPVGDLHHFQSESAGRYEIAGRTGHFNIRVYRKDKNYSWYGIYPLEAYENDHNISVQSIPEALYFLQQPYWHLTHLRRSSFDHGKRKLEIGKREEQQIPEVFFEGRPSIVPSPWVGYTLWERLVAWIITPMRSFKRQLK